MLRDTLVALSHDRLDGHSGLDGIDHGGKLKRHAVAGRLDDAASVSCHEGVGNFAVFAECADGADLVKAHEPRVTHHVSGHDCRQPPSDPNWLLLLHGLAAPATSCLP